MEATAQMNVRLSRNLKAAGDAALAEAGITPTEFIREIWEKISRGTVDVMQVREALREQPSVGVMVDDSRETHARGDALARGRALFDEGLADLGIQGVSLERESMQSDVDAYAEALMERMRERGTW